VPKFDVIARVLGGVSGAAILAVSTLVATLIAMFGGFVFFVDSVELVNYAARLAHFGIGSYYYTIGYPLLIMLSGFVWTGSIVPVLVIQTVFAALMPWLAFKTFGPFDWRAGLASGIVCLASLTPFYFQNTFFHDETSLFFGFLSIVFASHFFHFRRERYIYLSSASAIFAYLAQPAVIGFFAACWGAFLLLSFYERRHFKHVLVALGIFAVTISGLKAFEKLSMRRDHLVSQPSQLGRQIFFNEYILGSPSTKFDGVAADRLRTALVRFFANPPPGLHQYVIGKIGTKKEIYQRLFGRYESQPIQLVNEMFAAPNPDYFNVMWNLPDLSGQITDRMFLSASLAFIYSHPLAVAGYVWGNLIDFTVGPPWECRGDAVYPACRAEVGAIFYPALSDAVTLTRGQVPDHAFRFLTTRRASNGWLMQSSVGLWQWVYYDFRLVLLGAMVLGLAASFWMPSGLRWALGTVVAAYVLVALSYSFLVEPVLRYQVLVISICAFAAGAGGYIMLHEFTRAIAAVARSMMGRSNSSR